MGYRFRRTSVLWLVLLILAVSAPVTPAQLDDWGFVAVPSTATIRLEQSYCAIEDGKTVHAYSCLNRTWTSLQVSQGLPNVTITNDHFIVRDGPFFYGFSPRTGRFRSQLTWSPSATLVPRVSPQTWFSIVIDGNSIHIFQALDGLWTTYVFQGSPTVTMGTKCALIDDGFHVYGVSAFYGTPVMLPDSGVTVVGAYGNSGIATSAGTAYGFGAYTNTWESQAIAGYPTVKTGNSQAAFCQIEDGSSTLFFSGHTGTFATVPAPATATTTLSRAVAIVVDGTNVYGYSGLVGTVDYMSAGSPPTVAMDQFFGLVDDGAYIKAFSATTGTFSAALTASLADITLSAEMAYYQPSSAAFPTHVYSQFLNLWTATPGLTAATPYITAGSVVLVEPGGGIHGLSMRGTRWISESTPVIENVYVGNNRPKMTQTVVAQAGTSLWAFNERTQAWRMTTTSSPITTFTGNNTALITLDGTRAYGFSNWSDGWSSTTLNGTVLSSKSQVQSAYVQTSTGVHAYAGVGQLSTSHDYPEYWRAATQGSRVHVDLAAEPGSMAMLAVSLGAANIPIPPYGTILIDPTRMIVLATPGIPGGGLYGVNFQVPKGPGVGGLDLHFQAVVYLSSTFYLTNAVTIRLL